MNVKELIEKLQAIDDQYSTVSVITNGGDGWFTIDKLTFTDSFGCVIGVKEIKN